ncbi:MAG TPA: hypothetical protein VN924_18680 [Bryobacteraceae bacterium]|nr:hypothetical protein [Bryobacteraceae bacterium]
MKTLFAIVLSLGLLAAAGSAQPAVSLVVNAASSSYSPLPNSSIAQGSYFTIYGTGIGPATGVSWKPYPLPTTLQQTSVSVVVGGTTVAAYPAYVSASQINAVLPSNTPAGTGTLAVSYNGATSATFPITVAASSFGTFAWNEVGSGPGIFTNAVSYQLMTPFNTAKPGDYVTIWGTGLGPAPDISTEQTAPPTATNLCASTASCPVTVWVAGQQATVTYAGRSGFTAEDQIDFIVPAGVQGCYVQVAVEIGSVVGNFTSMSVDPNGATCQDADGINYSDIASVVESKGQANIAGIILFSDFLNVTTSLETAQWDNDTVTAEIGTFDGGALNSFQGFTLSPSVNNCTVSQFLQFPPPVDYGLAQVIPLDAGASLSVKGPNGTQTVAKNGNAYGAQPAGDLTKPEGLVGGETIGQLVSLLTSGVCPTTGANPSTDNCTPFYLTPAYAISAGTYTVTGTGGANVGAFSAPITVTSAAASFKWTNQSSAASGEISRTSPLTITWTGGDPNGFVDITAISSTLASGIEPAATTPGILVECIAPASAQTFTVPAYVLESLPSTANSTAFVPPGELLVGPVGVACSSTGATNTTCPADLTLPTGLDALYIVYHFIQGQNVVWQ